MLIEGQKHISFITRTQYFAGTDANLENRRSAGNCRGNGHESHDLLLAASGQAGEKTADCLDAVLGIAGDTNYCFGYFRDLRGAAAGGLSQSHVAHEVLNRIKVLAKAMQG